MKTKAPAKPRRLEEIADSKKGLFAICPTLLSVEPGFNKRENYGDLRQLADDIAANGLDQPLKIRKIEGSETIYIVSGHRRHKAITEILIPEGRWQDPANAKKIRTVDCYAEARGTTTIERLVSQVCGNTGLAYTLLEKAAVYEEILAADSSIKPADLARRFGESKQAVSDALRLVRDGCPDLLDSVRKGTMAATTAITLIKQAGTDPAAQKEALQTAIVSANGSGHITPKHLPATTPPTSDPSNPSDPSDPPTPHSSPQAEFTLYIIDGAPEDPVSSNSPFYHETDRFVLENPQAYGLERLHLLCASTSYGAAYGYRVNDHERLPDVSGDELDADPQGGFGAVLEYACRKAGLGADQQEDLSDLLFNALCDYFPESGLPKEPKHLSFVGASDAKTNTAATGSANPGFQQTMAAPSGGGTGSGGSTYLDPQTFKAVQKIEDILEDLAAKGKGIEDRVTTADILIAVLRNERPSSDLKNYLLGK